MLGTNALRIYPRGFFGTLLPPKLKTDEVRTLSPKTLTFVQQNTSTIEAHPDVDRLYAEYLANPRVMSSLEWREGLLTLAMRVFGQDTFNGWYAAQLKSPAFGAMHSSFIDDLARYAYTGRRDVTVTTWVSLVDHRDVVVGPKVPSDYMREYFKRQGIVSTTALIHAIITHEGGYSDLLVTLHILFGSYC